MSNNRKRFAEWTEYHLKNGWFDDGGTHHECATKREAERQATRTMRDEDEYYAKGRRPADADGFDDFENARSDADW